MSMKDPYIILGLTPAATDDDIRKAYRKMVKLYHPDRNQNDKLAEEKFKEINNAYDSLINRKERKKQNNYSNNADFDFSQGDMFEKMFNKFKFQNFKHEEVQDIQIELSITLYESYVGCVKDVDLDVWTECEHCHGNGTEDSRFPQACDICGGKGYLNQRSGLFTNLVKCSVCKGRGVKIDKECQNCHGSGKRWFNKKPVKIIVPAGVKNNNQIILENCGHYNGAGNKIKRFNDVKVTVKVREDKKFKREFDNLTANVYIPFSTLVLGGTVEFINLDDKIFTINIEAGTLPDEILRLSGKGFKTNEKTGDLLLTVKLKPLSTKRLNSETIEAIRFLETQGL